MRTISNAKVELATAANLLKFKEANVLKLVASVQMALLLSLSSQAAPAKCAKVGVKKIAKIYLGYELNGWRSHTGVNHKCRKAIHHIEKFNGTEGEPPELRYVKRKTLKIRKTELLGLGKQRYSVQFSIRDEKGKELYDSIIFAKLSNGRLDSNKNCSLLLSAPSRTYVSTDCRPN